MTLPQPLWLSISLFLLAFFLSYLATPFVIKRLRAVGRVAKDVNKKGWEAVEPGGIAPIAAFYIAVMVLIGFLPSQSLLALALSMLAIAFLGLVDDILSLNKTQKFVLPILAAIPLVVLKAASSTLLYIPFIGPVDLGNLYLFLYVPLAFTIASNLTNILAGFNGMEAGMGVAIHSTMAIIGYITGQWEVVALSSAYVGALLAFLRWNWYPAKTFPGDVMTMSTGALLAGEAIIYNLDWAMAFLLIPYGVDAVLKILAGVPSTGWWGRLEGGKLYPLTDKPVGFAQLLMKIMHGVEERALSLIFIALEVLAGLGAILFYLLL